MSWRARLTIARRVMRAALRQIPVRPSYHPPCRRSLCCQVKRASSGGKVRMKRPKILFVVVQRYNTCNRRFWRRSRKRFTRLAEPSERPWARVRSQEDRREYVLPAVATLVTFEPALPPLPFRDKSAIAPPILPGLLDQLPPGRRHPVNAGAKRHREAAWH